MPRHHLPAVVLLVALAGCTTHTPTAAGGSSSAAAGGISTEEAARVAPLAPAALAAVVAPDGVRLSWPTTGEDVAYHEVLRRKLPDGVWRTIGRTGGLSWWDRRPEPGHQRYAVRAVNPARRASPLTESAPVDWS
ncbi:hypothetical protein ACFO0M_03070 [Micromonospora mangrovi]|uniref:Fibronectin type III domain-containing protein n=2 Tax=Micromonospora TaxID=1873 RepID=A0AAU7M0M3_9ACTN